MGFASTQPVVEHLVQLQRAGLSVGCISKCSGISAFGITLILRGRRQRVRADTAEKLLSVKPLDVLRSNDGDYIPSVGTVRRLRALYAIGYSGAVLAAGLGYDSDTVCRYLTGTKSLVRAFTARKVADMFDNLQVCPPPPSRSASRAINRARKLGWAVPLAWPEDRIDDPSARPYRPIELPEGWLDEYEKLKSRGYTQKKIAALMGINSDSLRTRLRRIQEAA